MFFRKKKVGGASSVRQSIGASVAARLAADPHVTRTPVETVQMFQYRDFLTPGDCDGLMRMIDASSRPSTLLTYTDEKNFRTSDSCDMDRWAPDVRPTDERIAALLGIDPANGETMQGQRYAPGQQFRAHHDYFREDADYWPEMVKTGGQRTWTAMIFLNDVEEGGATWFPQAGIRVTPKRGLLLAWNNMSPNGGASDATLHEGTPVVHGTKYIITKWFREGPWIKQ